jgi:hypothetical protein
MVGDPMPNRDGEIHLDNCRSKKDIWKEYYETRAAENEQPLYLNAFYYMWETCMPHVKIPPHKVHHRDCK